MRDPAGQPGIVELLRDRFATPRPEGRALGPARGGDPARGGRDVEGVMSVDGGALRIRPPLQEGWGRTVLAYGPFPNRPGLVFAVSLLNGHNTSQSEVMEDTFRVRLRRWAVGSATAPVPRRLLRWLTSGRVRRVVRQARWWRRIQAGSTRVRLMDENLAVGLFPDEAGAPLAAGVGFVMHADGPRNGELRVGADGHWAPAVLGVQNVPLHLVVAVREDDVVVAAASLPGAHGLGDWPAVRPLGILPRPAASELWAGVHQALLGQIGFRADSRVAAVVVADAGATPPVPGGARDAGLAGVELADRHPATGNWRRADGVWWLDGDGATGLAHVALDPAALAAAPLVLAWGADADGRRELVLGAAGAVWRQADTGAVLAEAAWDAAPGALQILDDGLEVGVLTPDGLLFGRRCAAPAAGGCGIVTDGTTAPASLLSLETLPRRVALPPALHGAEPWRPGPTRTVFADPLRGAPGDLDGRDLPGGGATWRRTFGRGALDVGPDGARWRASVAAPLPGRTLYTIAWDDPDFAELEVTLTPPGTSRGQSEHGTAGFCLWQDDGHHLLVNTWLDDCYGGASLSSFPTIGGFEDLYDAIWTNVGDRIAWGRPLRLRLACDGLRYLVHIDDEPVLYRSLADIYPGCRPLRIRRVGLLGNWEWGADTGTAFADFAARRRDGSRADDAR